MVNSDKMDKLYEYKNFLVHYVFDEKVAQYVDMLYKHCEQTGHKKGVFGIFSGHEK